MGVPHPHKPPKLELSVTFGIGVWPPAIKTPLGRVGFPE
jgi:hypothetical protein